jgi:hypothetical protein
MSMNLDAIGTDGPLTRARRRALAEAGVTPGAVSSHSVETLAPFLIISSFIIDQSVCNDCHFVFIESVCLKPLPSIRSFKG